MSIPILVALFMVFVTTIALREQIVLGKQSSRSWEELVASLRPVRTQGLINAASATSAAAGNQSHDDYCRRFSAIGGPEGLRRVQFNAVVLMALAAYIEMWSVDANTEVIQMMRQDGLQLRRTATKLGLISRFSSQYRLASGYLTETAELYCGMVEQLLVLCKAVHVARYPALAAAVNW